MTDFISGVQEFKTDLTNSLGTTPSKWWDLMRFHGFLRTLPSWMLIMACLGLNPCVRSTTVHWESLGSDQRQFVPHFPG